VARVSIDLFDAYGIEILAGRNFIAGDPGTPVVIVNRSFAQMYLQDGNAVGLRYRYLRDDADPAAPWFQIVGVVRDFPASPLNFTRAGEPTIYHPAAVGNIDPIVLSVRVAGTPADFINRLREIGAEVDPTLQLRGVGVLSERYESGRSALRSMAWAAGLVTASVLLLSRRVSTR
jgi:hypothetical protein